MKHYLLLIILIVPFLCSFTIKGKIRGLDKGAVIYLYTTPAGSIELYWLQSQKVDSCAVDGNGCFEFQVHDSDFGHPWLLRTQDYYHKYFFSKDEDLYIEGSVKLFGLNGEKEKCGRDNILLQDISQILGFHQLTPIDRRSGIDWLKRHASEDVSVFATAYFYMVDRKLQWKDVGEILSVFPSHQQENPYYKVLLDHYQQMGRIQPCDPMPANPEGTLKPASHRGYKLSGYIQGMKDGVAELLIINEKGNISSTDTALICNNIFKFEGKLERPVYCNVHLRNTSHFSGFFLENSDIELNIKAYKNIFLSDVHGSQAENEMVAIGQLKKEDEIADWLKEHRSSVAGLSYLVSIPPFNYTADILENWLSIIDKSLSGYPEYKEVQRQIGLRRQFTPGQRMPDFTLPDTTGKMVALKNYRGKYVLLDFWASWCGPCRAEIPNLKKIWQKFHPLGLEIISITVDDKNKDWEKALAQEQMPWIQLTAKGSKVSGQYNVRMVPYVLLLDPAGKLIDINLRGEALMNKLSGILK